MILPNALDPPEFPFENEPLSPAIGLEIRGIRLDRPLDGTALAEIRAAFNRHHVLVFREQTLTPIQQIKFAEALGEPDIYPFAAGMDGFPVITPVVKERDQTMNFGGVWHSDTTYLERPPSATMLLVREVPPVGGDTLFASQVAAYDALSDGMKAMLAQLRAVNSSAKADLVRTSMSNNGEHQTYAAVHPVVRTHPETGAKALYVNPGHTVCFEGMTEAESSPILEFLFDHQTHGSFTCRVRWQPGTLVIWDNRACLHFPLNDYHGYRREMHRITLKGSVPF